MKKNKNPAELKIVQKIVHAFRTRFKSTWLPMFADWASITTTEERLHEIKDGGVYYKANGRAYADHVEMAGELASFIVSYGVTEEGALRLMRHAVFPRLRCYPNETCDHLRNNFSGVTVCMEGNELAETVDSFFFDGILHIFTTAGQVKLERRFYAATYSQAVIEQIIVTNDGDRTISVWLKGQDEAFTTRAKSGHNKARYDVFPLLDVAPRVIDCAQSETFDVAYCACLQGETVQVDFKAEYEARLALIATLDNTLIIKTPSKIINLMTRFAKLHASENIFLSKDGYIHCPGGGRYYDSTWCNDQCEYVNPLFGYLGYEKGEMESVNCYRQYAAYVRKDKAVVSSIICGNDSYWAGAGDRGDTQMYAYGLARYLLSRGDKETALTFLPSLRTAMEYTLSQKNEYGVIKSDNDELEGRFESGNANLSTSCLAYDAMLSLSYLERSLGNDSQADDLVNQAAELKNAIINYFAAEVEGYQTYRYCVEEKRLRSWICLPMVMGIDARIDGTCAALTGDKLRYGGGLLTRSGEETFWDRSALYAMRGLFCAGRVAEGTAMLEGYSESRLLGTHVPYAVEAFPEGNQAQLSAESGLYVRILTEGILGYRPTGLSSCTFTPQLPEKWQFFSVQKINLGGTARDILIKRNGNDLSVSISGIGNYTIPNGGKISISY